MFHSVSIYLRGFTKASTIPEDVHLRILMDSIWVVDALLDEGLADFRKNVYYRSDFFDSLAAVGSDLSHVIPELMEAGIDLYAETEEGAKPFWEAYEVLEDLYKGYAEAHKEAFWPYETELMEIYREKVIPRMERQAQLASEDILVIEIPDPEPEINISFPDEPAAVELSDVREEPDFLDICRKLVSGNSDLEVLSSRIEAHPRYRPHFFATYFKPFLLGYTDEIKSYFYDRYGPKHEVFEELTYDHISFPTLAALPSAIEKARKGDISRAGFRGMLEAPVLLQAILPELSRLNLNAHFLGFWPECISLAPDLEELNVWANNIRHVPSDIGKLKKLKVLKLANNGLSELPAEFSELKSLKFLELSANNFDRLPEAVGQLQSLEVLRATNNEFTAFPRAVCGMSSLRELDLSRNKINEIPDEIARMGSLETLSLSHNRLSQLPEGLAALKALRILDLTENPLSEAGVAGLRIALPDCEIRF